MADGICRRAHRSQQTIDTVEALTRSQKIKWRHKCAACAYEQGVADGLAETARAVEALTQNWNYRSRRGQRTSN